MGEQKHTAVVGSDRGGVGKSLVAQLLATRHFRQHGRLPVLVEVESDPRLSRIYGEDAVTLLQIGQDKLSDVERNPQLVFRMWDNLAELVLDAKETVIVDLGANLTQALASWINVYGEDGPWGTGTGLDFFAATTGDVLAIEAANRALGYMRQAVPDARRFLVVNERDEARFPLPSDSAAVKGMAKAHGLSGVARIPLCVSPGFAHVVDKRLRLDTAALMTPEEWQKAAGLRRMEAVRAERGLLALVDDGTIAFDVAYGPMAEAVAAA